MTPDIFELFKIFAIALGVMTPIIGWVWRISSRVQKLETITKFNPNHDDLMTLNVAIEKLNGSITTLNVRIEALENRIGTVEIAVQRIEQHLLRKGKE